MHPTFHTTQNLFMSSASCLTLISIYKSSECVVVYLETVNLTSGVLNIAIYYAKCICEAHAIITAHYEIPCKHQRHNDFLGNFYTLCSLARIDGRLRVQKELSTIWQWCRGVRSSRQDWWWWPLKYNERKEKQMCRMAHDAG